MKLLQISRSSEDSRYKVIARVQVMPKWIKKSERKYWLKETKGG